VDPGSHRINVVIVAMAEAAPGLWFGAHQEPNPFERDAKLDAVVCLSGHELCRAVHPNSLLIRLPLDDGDVPPPSGLGDVTKFISSMLDEGKTVFVMCDLGYNRSAMVTARVLMERGMTADAAIAQVRTVREGALGSHPGGLFRTAGLAYASWLKSLGP